MKRNRPASLPAPPSSSSPTSSTPPPSPNASATPPSARKPATSTPPSAPSSASTAAPPSKASSSATASSPSSPARARLSRPPSPAPAGRRRRPPPPPRPPRRRRHPRRQQRLRRRRQHRLPHQRPVRAGRSAGVGYRRSLARTQRACAFEDRGEQALKGVGEPVRVWAVEGRVMEPQVKYARTSDGVNIAYYAMGSGPPFVWLSSPQSHLLAERRVDAMRNALDVTARALLWCGWTRGASGFRTARSRLLARLHGPRCRSGPGESESRAGILLGFAIANLTAIKYASLHPENVSHLIIMGGTGVVRGPGNPILDSLADLAQLDWELASETIIRSFYGDDDIGLAALLRESVNPQQLQAAGRQAQEADLTDLLPRLLMPSLVLHDRNDRHANGPAARQVAAGSRTAASSRSINARGRSSHRPVPGEHRSSAASTVTRRCAPFRHRRHPLRRHRRLHCAHRAPRRRRLPREGPRPRRRAPHRHPRSRRHAHRRQAPRRRRPRRLHQRAPGDRGRPACANAGDDAGLPLHLGLHAGDVIREDEQRLRRRRQHRLAHQRPLRPGRGAGLGDRADPGANVGRGALRRPRRARAEGCRGAAARLGGAGGGVMEPRIQYAKTSDGVSIAYAEAGEGAPVLVISPAGFSHVELGWEAFAPVMQGLATRFRTLWFDHRGTGLSDRERDRLLVGRRAPRRGSGG